MPSAEARLDDGDIDAGRSELSERRRGKRLELSRFEAFGVGAHARDRRLEVGLRPADTDPLAPPPHVGREIGADGQAGVREQRLDEPRDARLAVRPDDMDGRIAKLRIAERFEQRIDPLEPEPVLRPRAE